MAEETGRAEEPTPLEDEYAGNCWSRTEGGSVRADFLATALAKAQAEMAGARKDSSNPHFRSKYADLASIWDACREALTKNQLSVVQSPRTEGRTVFVRTTILHASGQWISSELGMEPADLKPQTVGSCITYGRRYGLAAMVGVAPEDDDGEGAEGRAATGTGTPAPAPGGPITPKQAEFFRSACKNQGIPTATLCGEFGVETIEELPAASFNTALQFLKKAAK